MPPPASSRSLTRIAAVAASALAVLSGAVLLNTGPVAPAAAAGPDAVLQNLRLPLTAVGGRAVAINLNHRIAGWVQVRTAESARFLSRAVVWPDSVAEPILLRLTAGATESVATDINAAGQVVGYVITAAGPTAVLWNLEGKPTLLATNQSSSTQALAISDTGVIVGRVCGDCSSGSDSVAVRFHGENVIKLPGKYRRGTLWDVGGRALAQMPMLGETTSGEVFLFDDSDRSIIAPASEHAQVRSLSTDGGRVAGVSNGEVAVWDRTKTGNVSTWSRHALPAPATGQPTVTGMGPAGSTVVGYANGGGSRVVGFWYSYLTTSDPTLRILPAGDATASSTAYGTNDRMAVGSVTPVGRRETPAVWTPAPPPTPLPPKP